MVTRDRSTWPRWVRSLTTPWVLSPLIVFALLIATFEGYGYYTRHQKTTYARGGAFGADPVAARSTHHDGSGTSVGKGDGGKAGRAHAAKAHNSGGAAPGPTGGGHTTTGTHTGGGSHPTGGSTSPGATHSARTHHPGHSSSSTPSGPSAGFGTPATGVYTLAVKGSENAKFGPISACHNSYPSRATLDVHHATGESPTSYDFDMRLYPGSPNKHDERHIYKYSKSAVTLSYEQETVTCGGIKQSTTVGYSPTQVRVKLPLTVGANWHNHGGGSARMESGTSNVVRHTSLSVGNHSYPVYEIATKLHMSGSETGERDQIWWYSPDLGIPLKFSEALHGKRSGASYSENYTATVVGMP